MRKLISTVFMIILCYTGFLSSSIIVDSSTGTGLRLSIEPQSIKFSQNKAKDGNLYHHILGDADFARLETGKPDLPAFANTILIPNGTEVNIDVKPGKAIIYNNIELAPVQPFSLDKVGSKEPEFTINQEVFEKNENYPGIFAEKEATNNMRGQEFSTLWVYPYQYNPVTKVLSYYPNLKVNVSFNGVAQPISYNLTRNSTKNALDGVAINTAVVREAQKRNDSTENANKFKDSTEEYEYLIVTHPLFQDAAEKMAKWKNEKGIITKVVTTEMIGSTAEEIETYIDDAYNNWSMAPSYLLMLGDAEFLPTFYKTEHPSEDYDQGYIGTDIYYADIQNSSDPVADMAFGRISVDTKKQANKVIQNIIDYEQNPPSDPSFYRKITTAAYFQDDDGDKRADRRFSKTSEDIRNFLNDNQGYETKRIYCTNSPSPEKFEHYYYKFENDNNENVPDYLRMPAFAWDGNADDITTAVNAGAFLLTHRDHGNRNGWGDPHFTVSNVRNLDNGEKRPVVWTLNCETGWFDEETDDLNTQGQCFTEAWLRHETGGSVGLLASTRISFSGINDRLAWGFMNAIWPDFFSWTGANYADHDPIYRMGDVLNYGKTYMKTKYYSSISRKTAVEEFHWFGDPTMEIWTQAPLENTVNLPTQINIDNNEEITISTETPNALICLTKGLDLFINGYTDSYGKFSCTPSPQYNGEIKVVVSAHNMQTFIGSIPVIGGTASPFEASISNINETFDANISQEINISITNTSVEDYNIKAVLEHDFVGGSVLKDIDLKENSDYKYLYGSIFDGSHLWVTSGGKTKTSDPNMILKFDLEGNLLAEYPQLATEEIDKYGMKAITFDGDYIYGGDKGGFYKVDPADGSITKLLEELPASLELFMNLTYIDDEGFCTYKPNDKFYFFDLSGTVTKTIDTPENVSSVYGLAYDKTNNSFWLMEKEGTPKTTVSEFNIDYEIMTGRKFQLPLLENHTSQYPSYSLFMTDLNPDKKSLAGIARQSTSSYKFFTMDIEELWIKMETVEPQTLEAGNSLAFNVTLNSTGLSDVTKNANIKIFDGFNNIDIPVTLTVNPNSIDAEEVVENKKIVLYQNYPNPFNPSTSISFSTAIKENVKLTIFNVKGETVAKLINGQRNAGFNKIIFDASGLNSGVYYYTIETESAGAVTKKMLLIK